MAQYRGASTRSSMRFAISKLVLIPVTLPGPPLPSVSVLYFVSITVLVVPSSLLSGTLYLMSL